MDIGAIRDQLALAARSVVLGNGIKLTCTAYTPDSVTEPQFFVAEYSVDYDKANARALDEIEFTCRVLVGRADDIASQKVVDSMFSGSGPASLKVALEAARGLPGQHALNGACDDFRVERMQGNRWYQHAENTYVGGELTVRVIGSGD